MPDNDSLTFGAEPVRRRTLVMIIVVDVSGSMDGSKIGSVNTCLEELLPELANVGEADCEIKVAILTFSEGCQWLTPMPMLPEQFQFKELVTDSVTNFSVMCRELNKRMSRSDLLNSPGASYAPIMILMSDGEPTDPEAYPAALNELKKNKWYQTASKYAIPIGAQADIDALAAFVGNKEAVLKAVTRAPDLIKKIKMVALESATFATRSLPGSDSQSRNDETLSTIKLQEREMEDDPTPVDPGDEW